MGWWSMQPRLQLPQKRVDLHLVRAPSGYRQTRTRTRAAFVVEDLYHHWPSFAYNTRSRASTAKITVRKPSSMARKADDLLADLDQLGSEEQQSAPPSNKSNTKSTGKSVPASSEGEEEDLGELEKMLAAKPTQSSRPTTPHVSSSTTSGTNKSPKRAEHTPASSGPPSGRTSEDRLRNAPAPARSSGESRSFHQSMTPREEKAEQQQQQQQQEKVEEQKNGGGGGWWGSMFSAATAAVKQAESIAKEIRGNEEAQRWAEQVKGYGAGLSSLSKLFLSMIIAFDATSNLSN